MKHNATVWFILGISLLVYGGTFWAVWIGNVTCTIPAYLIVFLILLFLAYMFLHGAYYISHAGTKVKAEIITLGDFSEEESLLHLGRKKYEIGSWQTCVAKYGVDGTVQYEVVGKSKLFGYVPNKKADMYIIKHKAGVKTDYEVVTKKDYVINYLLGIPYFVMLIGWVILFICRGI